MVTAYQEIFFFISNNDSNSIIMVIVPINEVVLVYIDRADLAVPESTDNKDFAAV